MRVRLSLLIIAIIGAIGNTSAQRDTEVTDRIFVSFNTSTYTDFVTTPVRMVSTVVGVDPNPNDPSGPGIPVSAEVPYQSQGWSLFSIGIEPRFNLYEMSEEAAVAVSVPFSFGMHQVFPKSNDLGGSESFGGVQIPLLAKLYLGSGSTYDSEKNFGLSLGFGFEFNKLGLITIGQSDGEDGTTGWMMPVASLGIHFWRGTMPAEINLKYGFGGTEKYYIDKYGDPLKDDFGNLTSKSSRASSFKLSFGYLLNY